MMAITGTFLDEVTHDIPSQNWGPADWAADFDAMRAVGMDTVILIRAGYRDRATFDSRVLARTQPMMPAYVDLVDVFLSEAERCGMRLFFGTYDSGRHWHEGRYEAEADLNKAFCEEVVERYGHRAALGGWYLSHEVNAFDGPDSVPGPARLPAGERRVGGHVRPGILEQHRDLRPGHALRLPPHRLPLPAVQD